MIEHLHVKLISPAMIGGADPRNCDRPPTLRAPELRGIFRFWTRALGGTSFRALEENRALEEKLWGSTQGGQGVTLRTINHYAPTVRQFPVKTANGLTPTQMIAPGARFEIRFALPDLGTATRQFRERLQAVVWTALHLGGVGRRSRRGYGSLQWIPDSEHGDLLTGFLDSPIDDESDLLDRDTLSAYLVRGLTRVSAVLGGRPSVTPVPSARTSFDDRFRFETVDQVFVGAPLLVGPLAASYDAPPGRMEHLIHGMREAVRFPGNLPETHQMGGAYPGGRLASPMLWRVYRLTSGAFVPVMTWSPREGITTVAAGSNMHAYLTGTLRFSHSLAGQPL